ncbi:MAG: BMC domain-containing protein, partial [Clostridia bacterium]|nr:BMC domain-containing protein [Clostridia bacterium]
MGKAVGIIEVFGLTAAMAAVDAGCKAANVTVETLDKNKPGN